MKIAGVREVLEASKFALIQLIINPLIRRPQYWWHHKRPLILNELAVFCLAPALRVTTKVTTPTLMRCDIVRYACKSKRISFLLVA